MIIETTQSYDTHISILGHESVIVPFHNDFFPKGEHPEQLKSAHTL